MLNKKHEHQAEFFLVFPVNEVEGSLEGQMGSGWGKKRKKEEKK